MSELLLKDDREPLRDGYVRRCGAPLHIHKSRSRYHPPDVRLTGPVKTSIAAGSTKQFWISIPIPANAAAGTYEGSIQVREKNTTLLELEVQIEVLDLSLVEPLQNAMLWYRGTINCHHPHHYVRPEIFRTQLQDIYDHGFRSISLWETDTKLLQQALDVANSVGFARDVIMDGFRESLWSSVDFGKLRPVAYVSDELDGHADRLDGHVATMRHAMNHGVRTMASVLDWRTIERAMTKTSGIRPDIVSVYAPENQTRLALPSPRKPGDAEIYYYWQAHMEKPLLHRLLAGVLLWKSGVDGISPYCYQHLPGFPYSPYDDFDPWDPSTHHDPLGRHFKDHMATYPARRGVIHTLQWKGLADGLTDLRYIATLNSAIEAAESSDDPEVRERGSSARSRLTLQLDKIHWTDVDILSETSAVPFPDFDGGDIIAMRGAIVDDIRELTGGVAVKN
ncbi:MAG TPA: glycoside hydrolase domain-containing protein [Gemmatimonadaceae bacterium]|nr:glycoside hydrolase domain-containing protein [Gemmatimonadaceae bacterium]